ncbi:unnamed protein product [Parascedosporium putredinis]|uniref:CID domain-containing protein n=1 Tax=Parascedosporium putredinis TaxID=1442378 RepID=A0A9P1GU29_9PEZI|nr:unnamed protein product [Parascedosporium putredinis]CAI7987348.1 unnamed protein product [Parascedosporium putredinis]
MASPEFAIAKAAFSAALLRKDPVLPTSCTREDVDTFHTLFQDAVRHYLVPLFAAAASFHDAPKHIAKIQDLLEFWSEKKLVEFGEIERLKEAVQTASIAKPAQVAVPSTNAKSEKAPRETPTCCRRCMATLPWPASGPADKAVVDAVKALLGKVDRLFAKDVDWHDEPHVDFNELGERVLLDEVTGEVIGGETYYGWSREFCTKMKKRRTKPQSGTGTEDRGREVLAANATVVVRAPLVASDHVLRHRPRQGWTAAESI